MTDVQRDIGNLEARQDAADARLERIESKVDKLVDYMAGAKGGWRLLVAVGSAAATLAAGIAEALHWLHKGAP